MRDRGVFDDLVRAAEKAVSEAETLLGLFDRAGIVKTLRTLADALDRLPMLQNDLHMVRARLRAMQASDPDKTPRVGISTQIAAVRPPEDEDKK